MYGPELIKTFVVEIGGEEWPVNTTDSEHTFGCFSVEEALRDVIREAAHGIPSRIIATAAWKAKNGSIDDYIRNRKREVA